MTQSSHATHPATESERQQAYQLTPASESLLVRDLLAVLQGVDGALVAWDEARGAYVPTPATGGLPGPTARLVMAVGECGWLFRRMQEQLGAAEAHATAAGSAIASALCSAVQVEAGEYHRLVAALEAQHRGDGSVTLRRLHVWLRGPRRALRQLVVMLEDAAGMKGGALLSSLYRHTQSGDPDVAAQAARLLRAASVPFYRALQHWCVVGEVVDPGEDLFLARQEVTGRAGQTVEYVVVPSQVPSFMDGPTAQAVLLLGRSVHFISKHCGDGEWAYETRASRMLGEVGHDPSTASLRASALAAAGLEAEWSLRSMLQRAVIPANSHTMHLVFKRHSLMTHLAALKSFLLLGAGDFVSQLISDLTPLLNRPAAEVSTSTHHLLGVLEGAVRSSNAVQQEADVLDRLGVKLHTAHDGDTGWDIFSLTYTLDQPLASVVTPSALAVYTRIFKFLWRLKRVEHALAATWCRNATASHTLSTFPELSGILHRCHLMRADMQAFVQSLSSYVMFEVLETAWGKLVEVLQPPAAETSVAPAPADTAGDGWGPVPTSPQPTRRGAAAGTPTAAAAVLAAAASGLEHPDLAGAGEGGSPAHGLDLAGLVQAHEQYLKRILARACLEGRTSFIGPYINALLEEVLMFIAEQEQLYTSALRLVVSSQREDGADVSDELMDMAEEFEETLGECLQGYRQRMIELLGVLEMGGQELEAFRFLLLQFDFTGFYDKLRARQA